MLVCFRCSPRTKEQLDALVASGSYLGHGEAIEAAVANLFLLEKEFSNGHVVLEAPPKEGANGAGHTPVVMKRAPDSRKESERAAVVIAVPPKPATKPEVPTIFKLASMPEVEPRGLAELPGDMWKHGQQIPLERWILGQFNRLLPAKANCRALIHLYQEKGALTIHLAAEQVSNEALNLGDYLGWLDDEHKVERDDSLSTAFPQRRKEPEKARTRYANQFVVYQNGRGELSGLMIDLKLINVEVRKRERRIIPTHMAWEFAKLENPILDGMSNGSVQKFSTDEREFLLQHILQGVPVESYAYFLILQTILGGSNTPETIDIALKKYVTDERAEKLSPSFLTSQRSGAISRMSDLGLVERSWVGVRVTYGVTKDGEQFISRYKKQRKA